MAQARNRKRSTCHTNHLDPSRPISSYVDLSRASFFWNCSPPFNSILRSALLNSAFRGLPIGPRAKDTRSRSLPIAPANLLSAPKLAGVIGTHRELSGPKTHFSFSPGAPAAGGWDNVGQCASLCFVSSDLLALEFEEPLAVRPHVLLTKRLGRRMGRNKGD